MLRALGWAEVAARIAADTLDRLGAASAPV